jgi:pilus assembly protein Flp/PilA
MGHRLGQEKNLGTLISIKVCTVQKASNAAIALTRRNVMRRLSRAIARALLIESERGVTAIEYGLIASLIALAIITAVTLVGTNLTGLFNYIGGKVVAP